MEVILFRSCGWCITFNHSDCLHEMEYFGKLWVCDCLVCNRDYVPEHLRGVVVETVEDETDGGTDE